MLSWFQRNFGTTGNTGVDAMNLFMLLLCVIGMTVYFVVAMVNRSLHYFADAFLWLVIMIWVISAHREDARYHKCEQRYNELLLRTKKGDY